MTGVFPFCAERTPGPVGGGSPERREGRLQLREQGASGPEPTVPGLAPLRDSPQCPRESCAMAVGLCPAARSEGQSVLVARAGHPRLTAAAGPDCCNLSSKKPCNRQEFCPSTTPGLSRALGLWGGQRAAADGGASKCSAVETLLPN